MPRFRAKVLQTPCTPKAGPPTAPRCEGCGMLRGRWPITRPHWCEPQNFPSLPPELYSISCSPLLEEILRPAGELEALGRSSGFADPSRELPGTGSTQKFSLGLPGSAVCPQDGAKLSWSILLQMEKEKPSLAPCPASEGQPSSEWHAYPWWLLTYPAT